MIKSTSKISFQKIKKKLIKKEKNTKINFEAFTSLKFELNFLIYLILF